MLLLFSTLMGMGTGTGMVRRNRPLDERFSLLRQYLLEEAMIMTMMMMMIIGIILIEKMRMIMTKMMLWEVRL